MSTTCNIILELRPEDRKKNFKTPWGEIVNAHGSPYLGVYCHNDGYPSGVGDDLKGMFEDGDYKEALKFILAGDRSTTDLSYWAWRQETNAPEAGDTAEEFNTQNYLYIISEVNGRLTVREIDEEDEEEVDENQISTFVDDWYDENGSDYDEDSVAEMLDDCCEAVSTLFGQDTVDNFMGIIDGILRRRWEDDHE